MSSDNEIVAKLLASLREQVTTAGNAAQLASANRAQCVRLGLKARSLILSVADVFKEGRVFDDDNLEALREAIKTVAEQIDRYVSETWVMAAFSNGTDTATFDSIGELLCVCAGSLGVLDHLRSNAAFLSAYDDSESATADLDALRRKRQELTDLVRFKIASSRLNAPQLPHPSVTASTMNLSLIAPGGGGGSAPPNAATFGLPEEVLQSIQYQFHHVLGRREGSRSASRTGSNSLLHGSSSGLNQMSSQTNLSGAFAACSSALRSSSSTLHDGSNVAAHARALHDGVFGLHSSTSDLRPRSSMSGIQESAPLERIDSGMRYGRPLNETEISTALDVRFYNIECLERLGKGPTGEMWIGLVGGEKVAIKRLGRIRFTQDAISELRRDGALLNGLEHPHIARVLGVCVEPERACIISEFSRNRCLAWVLHSPATAAEECRASLTWASRWQIVRDIADALAFMHGLLPPMLHRHLRSSQVLLGPNMRARITDFGMEKIRETASIAAANALLAADASFPMKVLATPATPIPKTGEDPAFPENTVKAMPANAPLVRTDTAEEAVDGRPSVSVKVDAAPSYSNASAVSMPAEPDETSGHNSPAVEENPEFVAAVLSSRASPHQFTRKLVRAIDAEWHGAQATAYIAPEVLAGSSATVHSDVYAYAVILHELASGERPYGNSPSSAVRVAALAGDRPHIDGNWPAVYASVIADAWKTDPKTRPSFFECLARIDAVNASDGDSRKGSRHNCASPLRSESASSSVKSRRASTERKTSILKTEFDAGYIPARASSAGPTEGRRASADITASSQNVARSSSVTSMGRRTSLALDIQDTLPVRMGLWSMVNVCDWLRANKLGAYVNAFETRDITGVQLAVVTEDELAAMGIEREAHRRKILDLVRSQLRRQDD